MGLLDRVTTSAPDLPDRIVLFAPEKAGKTSFGCFAPRPIVLMTTGETGLLTLIRSGQVPPTAHLPPSDASPNGFGSWSELVEGVEALRDEPHAFESLVLDTGNGAEQMLLNHVCASSRAYKGNWTEFNSYGRGVSECVPIWSRFLGLLDEVRTRRGMRIIFLHHSKVKTFQDPTGKDYDQWRPEAVDKLWSLTHKWADVIAFYGNRVKVYQDKAEGEQRFLRCGPSPAIVAGNRYGMPDEITAGYGAKALWTEFDRELRRAKAKGEAAKAWTKEEFKALLVKKGKTWGGALEAIDTKQKTGYVGTKAAFEAVTPEHIAGFARWLEKQPDAPASPPPPAPVQAPAPAAQEGEQRSDPTTATATATAPTTAPTAPSVANSSSAAPATPPTTTSGAPATDPVPKPMPSADRRTAPPTIKPNPAFPLLELMHELDLSWTEIRDARGKGLDVSNGAGLGKLPPSKLITDLTIEQQVRLKAELQQRVEAKRQKARLRAATKAQREKELAAAEDVGAAS